MIEHLSHLKNTLLQYIVQAIEFGELWLSRFQNNEHLQQLLFALVVGAAVGWLLRSLVAAKQLPRVSHDKGSSSATDGKTKEEVELNARRRL